MGILPHDIEASPQSPSNSTWKGDEVVISGISGIFPSSDSTKEFAENLFNKVNMVTEEDLNFNHPEAPKHLGKINGISKFDAQFFKITFNQANSMEPMNKKILEQAYMAMYDSGINPRAYAGKKVGVFVGSPYSDTSNIIMYNVLREKGNCLSGCAKSMLSNRISFWIDAIGPSYAVDAACTTSIVCLEHAFNAMKRGYCDAAIVSTSNVCLQPTLSLNLRKCGMVCLDGKTKCFDKNSDGYVRAEAISCIFLQKAKEAKRIYAEVCHTYLEMGLRDNTKFTQTRPIKDIENFLNNFYSQVKVSPKEVEYVEANAAANTEADGNELEAISNIFWNGQAIKIGSVKSNMGNSEAASGLCAITKICLAYHQGKLPANLHYETPLDIPAMKDGKIEIVQDTTDFNRGYTAVNNFSITGINSHVLLKGHYKPKDISKYKSNIPRLVLISARKEIFVEKVINLLKSQPIDPELIGMLHNIYRIETIEHTARGYVILDTNETNETVSLSQDANYFSGTKRPLWLVFSGMGSQWPGMAAELMKIPIFASAIHRCHKALEPLGVDLLRIVTEQDKTIFDNVLYCFVGISAVQIGLSDVLKAIGLEPDYIIGHSQGEMAVAYFDNCLTAEDMILSAYTRGLVSLETEFIEGAMAAVGLGYNEVLPLLPPEIDVACHNSNTSATLSGPAKIVRQFLKELTDKGIFAKEIPSTNIAFHSRYIEHAGPIFLEKLKNIITNPILRSKKWVSTSVPQDRWHETFARYSSAEYHTNNLLSPVLFEESARLIPNNAVVVEVAPHGLLQAILKRSHPECIHIPLTKRGHPNQIKHLLEAFGNIYQEGFNLDMAQLYPKIDFPVSTETQLLSHYVAWDHSEDCHVIGRNSNEIITTINREIVFSIHDEEYKFIAGHIRGGYSVLPESALLIMVWETLGMYVNTDYKNLSVIFKNVQFHGEVTIKIEKPNSFKVAINKGNDYFEVTHDGSVLVNGYITAVKKPYLEKLVDEVQVEPNEVNLNVTDIYELLLTRGYNYTNNLQSIQEINFERTKASIKWDSSWLKFLDSLIQLNVLSKDHQGIAIPKLIKSITINTEIQSVIEKNIINAKHYKSCGTTRCEGVEIRDIIFENKSIDDQQPDHIDSLTFAPHFVPVDVDLHTAVLLNLQLVADNTLEKKIRIIEITTKKSSLSDVVRVVADDMPHMELEFFSLSNLDKLSDEIYRPQLIILRDVVNNIMDFQDLLLEINKDTFILTDDENIAKFTNGTFNLLTSMTVKGRKYQLIRKIKQRQKETIFVKIDCEDNFTWVPKVENELLKSKRVVIVSERQPLCGSFGLVKKLAKRFKNAVSLFIIDDNHAITFDQEKKFYKDQLQKNLTFNVYLKGHWGNYYYVPLSSKANVLNYGLISSFAGDIDSLRWVEVPCQETSVTTVQVAYAGPSINDAKKATAIANGDRGGFGMDFSGIDSNGQTVMGMISEGAISSTVQADPDLLWPVPKYWTLEEAATVPLPYVHACYCLIIKTQVLPKHSVFVNGGAGALGQAVIALCLSMKCKVFTSVSNEHKKRFLMKLFPDLDGNFIGCSTNGDFYTMVVKNTGGRKCDIVVNCGSGTSREAAMRCVARLGQFLDVNDHDCKENKSFGMSFLAQEKSYICVNISSLFMSRNSKEKKIIQKVIAEGIVKGTVRPLSRIVYPTTEVSRGFRLLSTNKHRGRVLIKIKDDKITTRDLKVIPRVSYSPKSTYIVICDETTLGIELANRLVQRGARKLILHLKIKPVSGYLHTRLESWKKLGASITISEENLHLEMNCRKLLKDAEKIGKVQGIFIVQESFGKKSWNREDFIHSYHRTTSVVEKMDVLSRNCCLELLMFAVISRVTPNIVDDFMISVNDKICQARLFDGLPALSFRIELMDELTTDYTGKGKLKPQNISIVLNALETSLKQKHSSSVTTFNLKSKPNSKYLEKVAKSLGIQNINDVDETLQVGDLIDNDVNVEELRAIIMNQFNKKFTADDLKNTTIVSIKALSEINNQVSYHKKINQGLGPFYGNINEDEMMATDVMIPVKTTLNTEPTSLELDGTETHLMLIPGFDGQHNVFKSICELLKVKAMVFQLGPDIVSETVSDMAQIILQHIKKSFVFQSKFYLLGYSFGVNVALEVASLLEREGHVGVVYCLDSSPDALRAQMFPYIGNKTVNELQNLIINHFLHLMVNDQNIELFDEELKTLTKWSEKIDYFVSKSKNNKHSVEYKRNLLDSAYQRILLAINYKPQFKLKSEIVLIKGIPHPKSPTLENDYGLSTYTSTPIKIFDIESDHVAAPYNSIVPSIVNKFLEPKLIEIFKNKNLCLTYAYGKIN